MVQIIEVNGENVEFPDDMSDDQIAAVVRGDAPATAPTPPVAAAPAPDAPSGIESTIAGIGQGATFGAGDEIYGRLASLNEPIQDYVRGKLFDLLNPEYAGYYASAREEIGPRSYEQYRDDARGINAAAADANPITYGVAEIGTGLVGGLAGAGRAVAGQTFRQAVPRLAGVGAAQGGVAGQGFSDADSFSGVAADTAQGAATGAVLGTALPGVGNLIGRAVGRGTGGGRAAKQFQDDLKDVGLTPQQASAQLADRPNMVAADLSENMQQRLGAVANMPGETPQLARQVLGARNEAQKTRLGGQFTAALNNTPVYEAAQAATARTQAKAGPLYERAYEIVVPPDAQRRLRTLIRRDPGAMRSAQQLLRRRGEDIDLEGPLNVRTVDKITGYLGGRARELRSGASPEPQEAAAFEKLRSDILGVIDNVAPTLPRARAIAADEFANTDAMKLGAKVFKEKTPNLTRMVRGMSESEREHFRVGVFEEVADMIANKPDAANLVRLFNTDKRREALALAFDNPELHREFMRSLADENVMFDTMARAMTGSPTASRLAFGQQMTREPTLNPLALVGRAVQAGTNRALRGPNERANNELGQLLLSRDPQRSLQQLLQPAPLGMSSAALASPAAVDPQRTLAGLLGQ